MKKNFFILILVIFFISKTVNGQNMITIQGRLIDKYGNPVQATISISSYMDTTDSNGNYLLQVPEGVYDIKYITSNFWIMLPSFNLDQNKKDLINYITIYDTNISFSINISEEQTVKIYSDRKSARILVNGNQINEVNSFADLSNNTWFYDFNNRELYVKSTPPSPDCNSICESKGYLSGICRTDCVSGENPTDQGCQNGFTCCCSPMLQCTPGNDIIKQTSYPSGSCQSLTSYTWSHSTCGSTSVCNQGSCNLINATLTSYTLPSVKYARGNTISIPYTIKNTGSNQWCFITEAGTTKADGSGTLPNNSNSVAVGSSTTDSLSYQVSCSDPLGAWSGSLYIFTDYSGNGGWNLWGAPTFSFNVVECLNDQDCVNCLGNNYICNTTTNKCQSHPPQNLFLNPSLEDDSNNDGIPDYWTIANSDDISAVHDWCTVAHTGSRAICTAISRNDSAPQWYASAWTQNWDLDNPSSPFKVGGTYMYRTWYQTYNGNMTIYVGMWDSNWNWMDTAIREMNVRSPTSSTWVQSDWLNFTIPSNAKHIALGFGVGLSGMDSGVSNSWGRADDFEAYENVISQCGNGVINSGEACDPPATNSGQCPQLTSNCDYGNRKYCTRDAFGDCNNACQCALDSWNCGSADDSNYCSNCGNHCGDGFCNCGETSTTCPSECGTASYSAQFSQSGIPAGTSWGVFVGGSLYSTTGSSITVSGLSVTVSYSYNSPVSGGSGIQYFCNSGCSGSVTSSASSKSASYVTQYYLTMSSGTGGSVSPNSGWQNSGSSVGISATANSVYSFSSWSGSGSGSYSGTSNPSSVTMNGPISETASFVAKQSCTGCCDGNQPNCVPNNAKCDDGNACTVDTCQSGCTCTHTNKCSSPSCCLSGSCYPEGSVSGSQVCSGGSWMAALTIDNLLNCIMTRGGIEYTRSPGQCGYCDSERKVFTSETSPAGPVSSSVWTSFQAQVEKVDQGGGPCGGTPCWVYGSSKWSGCLYASTLNSKFQCGLTTIPGHTYYYDANCV